MTRNYAIVNDNIVVSVEILTDDQYVERIKTEQIIVDVQDLAVTPQVGWLLNGNKLTPPPAQVVNVKEMIKAAIKRYQTIAPELLRDLYATNTLLGITIQQSDALFEEYTDVLTRISQGAFPSAIYRLQQKTPSGFVTQQMLNNWIQIIQSASVL